VINLCVVLLWLPWLFASLEVIEMGSFSWLKQFGAGQAFSTWRRVHGMQSALPGQPYIDLFILLLGLAGLYSLRHRYALVGLLLGLLVSSSIFIWLYGFFASPIYVLRSILWGSLFSAVLVGIGIGALPTRLGYGVILLILVGGTAGVFDYYENNRAENEDWRSAALLVKKKYRPNDIMLFRAPYVSEPFSYYFGEFSPSGEILGWDCGYEQLLSGQVRRNGQRLKVSWTKFEPEARQQIAKKPGASLWIIESHCNPQSWDRADAILFPNWVLRKTYDFKGMLVHRMVSSGLRIQ